MTRTDNQHSFAVLFVDDEEKAQKYFRMAYADEFPILTAGSVPEALEILEQQADAIAILITDQRMPGQQGVDLLKRVRADWPGIVRILTTAYSDLDDAIAAVNRGEILRYVTKPWDIQALRIDLRHAMDFFLLRRERDLLIADKFSVRQSMVHADRLRDLLAIAAGFTRLRHAPHAVAAWLQDSLGGAAGAQPEPSELELWGLEVKETMSLMEIHRSLRAPHESVEPGFPDRRDLAGVLGAAGLTVEGTGGEATVRQNLIGSMIATLAELAGNPASARIERGGDAEGHKVTSIRIAGPGPTPNPFAGSRAFEGRTAGSLGCYLIAWHHGGAMKAESVRGQWQFLLTLPDDPDAVSLPVPDEDWLAEQFALLEDWQ